MSEDSSDKGMTKADIIAELKRVREENERLKAQIPARKHTGKTKIKRFVQPPKPVNELNKAEKAAWLLQDRMARLTDAREKARGAALVTEYERLVARDQEALRKLINEFETQDREGAAAYRIKYKALL